ncbi:MAG: 4Fe-4S binding protein [bacterium]
MRVIISLAFFLFTLYIFVDVTVIFSVKFIHSFLFLQVVPSLLDFITLFSLGSSGIFFVLAVTLLFGRVYCSSVCPLGTLSDICIGINARTGQNKNFRYRKPLPWVGYLILSLTVLLFLFGNVFVLTLLDPFSLAGKFFADLVWPFVTFENFPSWPSMLVSGVLFATIVLLAVFKERWYCAVICPVGTLLGLLSKTSLFRIWIVAESCTDCGICSKTCKSGCIDVKNRKIDFSRCVLCFNCLSSCPEKAMEYGFGIRDSGYGIRDTRSGIGVVGDGINSRRDFLKTTILTASLLALPKPIFPKPSEEPQTTNNPYPATPPGSVSYWNYTEKCISCHLCISVCPTQVLQPSLLEFGLTGILQPKMDYERGFCDYTCRKCLEICPTGALLPVSLEQKKRIQIGTSKLIRNLCIPFTERKPCSLCADHCQTQAIKATPFLGELKIPVISEKRCIGCGHCENICPTRPTRAIYVEPLLYHRVAMKPKQPLSGTL